MSSGGRAVPQSFASSAKTRAGERKYSGSSRNASRKTTGREFVPAGYGRFAPKLIVRSIITWAGRPLNCGEENRHA